MNAHGSIPNHVITSYSIHYTKLYDTVSIFWYSCMHIHILGICGTFMGGIAVLAKQLGHKVTGSDLNVYPPMSTQLEEQGIELIQDYA